MLVSKFIHEIEPRLC